MRMRASQVALGVALGAATALLASFIGRRWRLWAKRPPERPLPQRPPPRHHPSTATPKRCVTEFNPASGATESPPPESTPTPTPTRCITDVNESLPSNSILQLDDDSFRCILEALAADLDVAALLAMMHSCKRLRALSDAVLRSRFPLEACARLLPRLPPEVERIALPRCMRKMLMRLKPRAVARKRDIRQPIRPTPPAVPDARDFPAAISTSAKTFLGSVLPGGGAALVLRRCVERLVEGTLWSAELEAEAIELWSAALTAEKVADRKLLIRCRDEHMRRTYRLTGLTPKSANEVTFRSRCAGGASRTVVEWYAQERDRTAVPLRRPNWPCIAGTTSCVPLEFCRLAFWPEDLADLDEEAEQKLCEELAEGRLGEGSLLLLRVLMSSEPCGIFPQWDFDHHYLLLAGVGTDEI